jgi:hypothetical protein
MLLYIYIYIYRERERERESAVTKLRHSEQFISVTMITHATEEYVTSAVMLCNNRRTAGSFVLYAVLNDSYVITIELLRGVLSAVRAEMV